MARFHRDEQRTYPIWWLIAGGLFIFSTIWACYAEFVTRVPWQKEQEAFKTNTYTAALSFLPSDHVMVSPKLKKSKGKVKIK